MKWSHIFFVFCAVALVLYGAFLGLVALFKNAIIFPAPPPSYSRAQMFLPLANGERVAAVWLPAASGAPAILYSHGNGEDLGEIAEVLRTLNARGFSVLAYDYVGYGLSAGKPDEEKIYMAADAAWKWLVDTMKIPAERIALMGYSLGSAAASHLAAAHPDARCLVLSGAFSDGVNAVCPVRIVPMSILDNASKLAGVRMPVLVLHGTRDFVVPPRNARKIFSLLPSPDKRLVWFEGAGHALAQAENYFDEVCAFVNNPRP